MNAFPSQSSSAFHFNLGVDNLMSKTWKDKEFKKLSRIHTRPEVILKPHPTKTELLQEGELEDSNGWFDDEDFYEYGQVEEA